MKDNNNIYDPVIIRMYAGIPKNKILEIPFISSGFAKET